MSHFFAAWTCKGYLQICLGSFAKG